MSLVFLWTDILVWAVVVLVAFLARSSLKSIQNRKQFRQIFESPVAMASAVVLVFYFAIALLDSIHFKPAVDSANKTVVQQQVISVIDKLFEHLITQQERTYSAPFATHEYSRSLVYDEAGNVSQQYLPLKYGGQHLLTDSESPGLLKDVLNKTVFAVFIALLITLVLVALNSVYQLKSLAKHQHSHVALPWWSAYLTVFLILAFLSWAFYLSHYYHVLGTDKVGQDVFYQSIKSIRTGVLIGGLTTLVMLPLALLLGISAGYFKGWVDDVVQYLYTTLNSIPGVLLIAAAVLVMQVIIYNNPDWFSSTEERADIRLLFLIFILGMTSWTGLCRLLRAETLKISQIEYVSAAKAFGLGPFKIIKRHIMPNLLHLVLIAVVLDFSSMVLAEAVLSYVGIGVDPTMYSWGNMINQARLEMAREPMVWWSLLSAFLFMFVLVLAANLFSDRVQFVLDPRAQK